MDASALSGKFETTMKLIKDVAFPFSGSAVVGLGPMLNTPGVLYGITITNPTGSFQNLDMFGHPLALATQASALNIEIPATGVVIGRAKEAAVKLGAKVAGVSGAHVAITATTLKDTSSGGTFVHLRNVKEFTKGS
jgi:hypothetical protein